jgi:hypothetical protein
MLVPDATPGWRGNRRDAAKRKEKYLKEESVYGQHEDRRGAHENTVAIPARQKENVR